MKENRIVENQLVLKGALEVLHEGEMDDGMNVCLGASSATMFSKIEAEDKLLEGIRDPIFGEEPNSRKEEAS